MKETIEDAKRLVAKGPVEFLNATADYGHSRLIRLCHKAVFGATESGVDCETLREHVARQLQFEATQGDAVLGLSRPDTASLARLAELHNLCGRKEA